MKKVKNPPKTVEYVCPVCLKATGVLIKCREYPQGICPVCEERRSELGASSERM